ncbi:MAG: 2-succinyl-5-enolpyruvyl-6-hydroxy-3-cyclohexene-1-carboxylic-acid synthase [Flavobacteriales bacterium]|nr:2-succinyl-5-enolpyruvyl-6-hydroxy-3-cyclohexene-1-carboxylic-acid synthase [Bacteroidota bacterium]MCB9240789.1 2-succinyl-5-enolpyruvyl-6-hydroxy-3-cyclohexene-1-carboxylic-acid synthase [Flavobacteriales bacterium]
MLPEHHDTLSHLVDSLIQLGTTHAVVSPGSRNAPNIHALVRAGITCHSVLDERSAGYQALGMSVELDAPVILCCTSGTAVLNYGPAIAEAFYDRIPIIALTADRPGDQIDQWDGQAIRQTGVFTNHVVQEFTVDLESDHPLPDFEGSWNMNGPIHINVPLREPLYDVPVQASNSAHLGHATERRELVVTCVGLQEFLEEDWSDKKVLLFQGMDARDGIQLVSNEHPVLSDVTAINPGNVKHWDLVVSAENCPDELIPDVLITSGTTTVSKGLKQLLKRKHTIQHYHVASTNAIGRMFGTEPKWIDVHRININRPGMANTGEVKSDFYSKWIKVSNKVQSAMQPILDAGFNEISAVQTVIDHLPGSVLHAANSLPVRILSWLGQHTIRCNRGTSGIDGCTSTAVGAARVSENLHVLISGDLAFQYDSNAFWGLNEHTNLKVVVLNNYGGGIFKVIDGPQRLGTAISFQTTPHDSNFSALAEHMDLQYFCARSTSELTDAIPRWLDVKGPAVLEVQTDVESTKQCIKQLKQIL